MNTAHAPVTRSDLDDALGGLRDELRDEIHTTNSDLGKELKANIAALRDEFKADNAVLRDEFKADNAALRDEFKADNAALRTELRDGLRDMSLQIADSAARTTNVVVEHIRGLMRSMDDRYRDLPGRVRVLEERADARDRGHRDPGSKP